VGDASLFAGCAGEATIEAMVDSRIHLGIPYSCLFPSLCLLGLELVDFRRRWNWRMDDCQTLSSHSLSLSS
jgi:hypothetical protein